MTPQAIDYKTGINSAWSNIATFVPKLVAFLIVLVIGYFVVKILSKAVNVILEKVGFDGAVERGGIKRMLAKSSYDASDIVAKLVLYTLMLFVLQVAFGVFGHNPISDLLRSVIAFLPRIIVAIVIVVIGAAIAAAVKKLASEALSGLSYGPPLGTAASVLILLGFVKAALDEVNIATSVTGPVLYALLGTVAGIAIIGVGGGLVRPMQARWEQALTRGATEAASARDTVAANRQRLAAQAQEKADAYTAPNGPANGSGIRRRT